MLSEINPKLPMRNLAITNDFYCNLLGFHQIANYQNYLILKKDNIEIHFFEFKNLNPLENYGQVYIRTNHIEDLYHQFIKNKVPIHPNAPLEIKAWGQKEFSILDPDNNLLTFGQSL